MGNGNLSLSLYWQVSIMNLFINVSCSTMSRNCYLSNIVVLFLLTEDLLNTLSFSRLRKSYKLQRN